MSDELKPCPFCGGEPQWQWHSGDALWIECTSCGAIGPQHENSTGENQDETLSAWNTRTDAGFSAGIKAAAKVAEAQRLKLCRPGFGGHAAVARAIRDNIYNLKGQNND